MPMPWEQDYGGAKAPAAAGAMPWEKDYAEGDAPDKGFWQRLSEGQYPTLYNPKSKLFPGPTGKPPQMRGLDLPQFGVGMGEAPGVTMAGAAAPLAATLPAEGAAVIGGGAARAFSALPEHVQTAIISAATMAGAAGAKDLGLPEWLVHWAENRGLIRGFGKHNP